jgi:hypothetical protein
MTSKGDIKALVSLKFLRHDQHSATNNNQQLSPWPPTMYFLCTSIRCIQYKDKTQRSQCKMSSSKKTDLKWDFATGVYQSLYTGDSLFLVNIQSCWNFQPSFVICTLLCCPSPLLSGSTLYLTRFRTSELLDQS